MTNATSGEIVAAKKKKTTKRRSTSTRTKAAAATKSKTSTTAKAKVAKPKTKRKPTTRKSSACSPKKTKKTTTTKSSETTQVAVSDKGEGVSTVPVNSSAAAAGSSTAAGRKAPTNFATKTAHALKRRQRIIIVGMLLLIGVGSSAVVGYTDAGRIDINQKISERNARITANAATADDLLGGSAVVPVQNRTAQVDGGLIGIGPSKAKQVRTPKNVATSSASSTAGVASSTATSSLAAGEQATTTLPVPYSPNLPPAEVAGASTTRASTSPEED